MLYLLWTDESSNLGGYLDFHSPSDKSDEILDELNCNQTANLIAEVMDILTEHGPPQHAWDQVAPGSSQQQERERAKADEVEELQTIE